MYINKCAFISAVSELRKPKFIKPLEAQQIPEREPITMTAVCTADPIPNKVAWYFNDEEVVADATVKLTTEHKKIENNLKEITYKLHVPTGLFIINLLGCSYILQ